MCMDYGCESSTLNNNIKNYLEAAEMWFYRKILKISSVDHVTNEEILEQVGQSAQLMHLIMQNQLQFFGHPIRKGQLENRCLSGKFHRKIARDRQRKIFLDNFKIDSIMKI